MPEPISKLYAENKRIQAENKIAYDNPLADIISPLVRPKELSPITTSPGAPSPTETISAYSDYVAEPAMVEDFANINMMRAEGQSFGDQLGNVAMRALVDIPLGAISNLASMVDFEDYFNADNEVGNAMSNYLNGLQDQWRAANPIYREKPGTTFDVGDSGWWMDNASMLVDSAGAFALAGMVSGSALGNLGNLLGKGVLSLRGENFIKNATSKAVKAMEQSNGVKLADDAIAKLYEGAKAAYVSKVGGMAATPLNAIALNQAESVMESTGVYNDVYNNKLAEGKTPDEAKQIAADAASLNINLNRGNFILNMTSAGLFTKSAKAIKATYGSAAKQVLGESVQESMEEGVNYIAQKEAMLYADDPVNYQPNSDRMIGHLADPEGVEAMAMGAAGGAIQTGMSELLTIKKEKAKEAMENVNKATASKTPGTSPKDEYMMKSAKLLDNYINKIKSVKMGADPTQTKAEVDGIMNEYIDEDILHMTTWKDSSQLDNKILADKEVIAKQLPKDASPEDINEQELAKKRLDRLEKAKQVIDADPNFWKYNNRPKVLNKELEVESLGKTASNLRSKVSQVEAVGGDTTTFEAEAKAAEDLLTKAKTELAILKGDEGQAVELARIAKEKADAAKAAQDAAAAKNKAGAKASNPPVKPPVVASGAPVAPSATRKQRLKDPQNGLPIAPSSLEDAMGTEANPGILWQGTRTGQSGKTDAGKQSIKDTIGVDEDTIGIRSFQDKDGNLSAYVTSPAVEGVEGADEINDSIEAGMNDGVFSPNFAPVVRKGLDLMQKARALGRNIKMNMDGLEFDINEFEAWAKTAGPDGSALDTSNLKDAPPVGTMKLTYIQEFLKFKAAQEDVVATGSDETAGEPDGNLGPDKGKKERDGKDIHRTVAMAINYTSEESKTTDDRKATIGTGVIITPYLDNADPDLTKPGVKLVIKVHKEEVDTYNYRPDGTLIVNSDGSRSTTKRSAKQIVESNAGKSDNSKNELPIGIYIANEDGTAGRLVGFLPESRWMREVSDGDHVNIKNDDKEALEADIATVEGLRNELTKDFESDTTSTKETKAEVTSVSHGNPFYGKPGDQPATVSKNMPDLVKDAEKEFGHQPFAAVSGASIVADGQPVEGVINEEYVVDPTNVKQGSVVIILPTAAGGKIAVRGASNLLSDMVESVESIISGIKAFAGLDAESIKARESYKNAVKKHKVLSALDTSDYSTIRNYLKQFVFLESIDAITNNPAYPQTKRYVTLYQNKSGEIILAYGTKEHGDTRIKLNGNQNLNAQLDVFNKWLRDKNNEIRHNFDTTNMSASVISIGKDKARVLANTKAAFYATTVSTFAKTAGKSSGKRNIYTIQPVIAFEQKIDEVPAVEAPVVDAGTVVKAKDSQVANDVVEEGPVVVGAALTTSKRNRSKKNLGDPLAAPGIETQFKPEQIVDNDIQAISDEEIYYNANAYDEYMAAVTDNPLWSIEDFGNPHDNGAEIRRHCS